MKNKTFLYSYVRRVNFICNFAKTYLLQILNNEILKFNITDISHTYRYYQL